MSTRKYSSDIYNQQDIQAWRYGGSSNIDRADIDADKELSITLADGQKITATGRAGSFSETGVAGRIFYSDGNVGIGPVQNPLTSLYVSSNNTAAISVASYSDTHSPKINIDNARGNSDNPSDSVVGDTSSLVFRNYQGDIWRKSGSVRSTLKSAEGKANLDFYTNGGDGEVKRVTISEDGNLGIGEENPVATLDVNGNIRAAEYGWGTVLPYFGSPRYKISELTDKLWKADIRFTSDIKDLKESSEELSQDEFDALPFSTAETSWRQPLKFVSYGNENSPTSGDGPAKQGDLEFDDSEVTEQGLNTAYSVVIKDIDENGVVHRFTVERRDYYISENHFPKGDRRSDVLVNQVLEDNVWVELKNDERNIDTGVKIRFLKDTGYRQGDTWIFSTRHTRNHEHLFTGQFTSGPTLENGEEHSFVIRWAGQGDVSDFGMDYPPGKVYVVFNWKFTAFEHVIVQGFYAHSINALQYGSWLDLANIESTDDPRNITYPVPGSPGGLSPAIFEVDIPNQPLYLLAIRVKIKVPAIAEDRVPPLNSWKDIRNDERCQLSEITLYQERGNRSKFELPYFNKYDDKNTFYGAILHGDGSKENPSISFANKDTSGLYFDPEQNIVILASNENDAIAVDSSGDIVKLGQDVPVANEVLTWEGDKAVWSPIDEPASISDSDGDTKIQVEEGDNDEDKIRFDTAGVERMIIDNLGSVGIGTDSPSEILHIASAGKAAIFVEADTNDSVETDTSYIKLSQDGGKVTSHLGFNSGNNKNPENEEYPGTLSNALLITNKNTVHDPAVQIGANNSVIATFKNGMVGIGENNPSSMLDVNGEIAADSITANSVDVNGLLSFNELAFGTVYSYDGIRKYPIRELNDSLWRADIRAGNSLNYAGTPSPIYYPKNLHGENIAAGNTVTLLSSSSADPGEAGANSNDDIDLFEFNSTTSWRESPQHHSGQFHPTERREDLPEKLFNGRWDDGVRLANGESHRFVINFRKHKGFNLARGLAYGEGKFYLGFFNISNNIEKITLEGFVLQNYNGVRPDTGRWVPLADPITREDRNGPRNVNTLAPNSLDGTGRCTFEMTVLGSQDTSIRAVVNQRNGEVIDPDGARNRIFYLSAIRVTIDVPKLPGITDDQTEQEWWEANRFNQKHLEAADACYVSDMAMFFVRRQPGVETAFFNKYDRMTALPGGIWFQDGSKDEPTVSFNNADNYGIFYDSTNSQMGLSGGGNEAITIDASGDITKLGQDVPAQNDVLTWDGDKAVWSPNAAAAGITEVLEDLTPQLGGNLDVNGNSITSSGDLDISINSSGPGAVHVAGSEPTISIQRGSNDNPSSLDFVGAAGFVGAYVRHIENQVDAGGTNNDLVIGTGAEVTERIRITGDGRVGIGITNPEKQLHVASDIKVDGKTTLNGAEYTWPAADGQSGQALITNGSGDLSWANVSSIDGTESQQIMIDFNVSTRPTVLTIGTVHGRADGVGNVDGGSFNTQAIISSMGTGTPQPSFNRGTDTTFKSTIQQARNSLICGFIAEDSSLVKFQTVVLPKNNWPGGIYISIWRGTYTNHSNGDITWDRVSLIQAVNDQGTDDDSDDFLVADTIFFGEDVISSNNSFSKGDLWSLLFWADNALSGSSSAPTWVTGNLFFEKD